MTKSEEKLLELLLEKIEALESKVEDLESQPSGGTVIHNHYHSHYHSPRYSTPYWNNWPYYTTWNVAKSDGGNISVGGSSGIGGGSYSLASSTTSKVPSNTASSINYGKLEDEAEMQVFAVKVS